MTGSLLQGAFQWTGLRNEMNKTELIDQVAEIAQVSKADALRVFNAFIDTITTSLKKGDTVTIVGFGAFKVGHRKARSGRNPQTGATINIPAAKTPRFSAGKPLKDAVNT